MKQERNRTCVLQLSLIWTDKLLHWRDALMHFKSHFIFLCMLENSLNTSSVDSFSDLYFLMSFMGIFLKKKSCSTEPNASRQEDKYCDKYANPVTTNYK